MTPEQFRRVEELCHRFRDAPAEERAPALDEACPDDSEIRAAVGEILDHANPDQSLTDLRRKLDQVLGRIEKLREAELLLLEGYEGMKDHPDATDDRKREALERIVKLYEAWHEAESDDEGDHGLDAHATKTAEWRAKLPASQPALQPAGGKTP